MYPAGLQDIKSIGADKDGQFHNSNLYKCYHIDENDWDDNMKELGYGNSNKASTFAEKISHFFHDISSYESTEGNETKRQPNCLLDETQYLALLGKFPNLTFVYDNDQNAFVNYYNLKQYIQENTMIRVGFVEGMHRGVFVSSFRQGLTLDGTNEYDDRRKSKNDQEHYLPKIDIHIECTFCFASTHPIDDDFMKKMQAISQDIANQDMHKVKISDQDYYLATVDECIALIEQQNYKLMDEYDDIFVRPSKDQRAYPEQLITRREVIRILVNRFLTTEASNPFNDDVIRHLTGTKNYKKTTLNLLNKEPVR